MKQSQIQTVLARTALLGLTLISVATIIGGCASDEHPSQMVKMRSQMMDQRKAMANQQGGGPPGIPPSAPTTK